MVVRYVKLSLLHFSSIKPHLGMWKDRVLQSDFKENAIKMGLASDEDIKRISDAWRDFPSTQDAWHMVVHGEVICTK